MITRRASEEPEAVAVSGTPPPVYAGTSGWAYATWKPGFYPEKTPSKKFLSYYASVLNSVEVNYTFRKLPTNQMLEGWLASVPDGFRFSFKAPQRITHFSRLRDCELLIAEFLKAIEPARKAGKLGLLLFQLPPNFKADAERLKQFLKLPALKRYRIAFEFRHESWFAPEILATLRKSKAALCVAESDDLSTPQEHTAPGFACFRLRRTGGYKPKQIKAFAAQFTELTASGREVYAYFKHEDEPTGALNAGALRKAAR